MGFNRFQTGVTLRVAALMVTALVVAWMLEHTPWYVSVTVCATILLGQVTELVHFTLRINRELARFLEALTFDDTTQTFTGLSSDRTFRELGAAMGTVQERIRRGRKEKEEQARYLGSLISHVPVALIAIGQGGDVQLLNLAARRLFEGPLTEAGQFARHGVSFATGVESLLPGNTTLVRMERTSGTLQLKAAATDLAIGGVRRRIVSLQNIESELSAQELAAWQTVIRVMAHEVMNSLTPVSSLSVTAHDLVQSVLQRLALDDPNRPALQDTVEALAVLSRRSEGLLNFVQNHRRMTARMVTKLDMTPVQRLFARLQRLLASELANRNIRFTTSVEPETLEISADPDLIDQALINLVRNAIDALEDSSNGQIVLSARRDVEGRVVLAVEDNGPGIAPEQREKVFVPFFTTKKRGSGVGLTLVKQIATVHGSTVEISQTSGGGATLRMRF
jgi:two-component system nitrogen regulation sensor histidine kinase NtrY